MIGVDLKKATVHAHLKLATLLRNAGDCCARKTEKQNSLILFEPVGLDFMVCFEKRYRSFAATRPPQNENRAVGFKQQLMFGRKDDRTVGHIYLAAGSDNSVRASSFWATVSVAGSAAGSRAVLIPSIIFTMNSGISSNEQATKR